MSAPPRRSLMVRANSDDSIALYARFITAAVFVVALAAQETTEQPITPRLVKPCPLKIGSGKWQHYHIGNIIQWSFALEESFMIIGRRHWECCARWRRNCGTTRPISHHIARSSDRLSRLQCGRNLNVQIVTGKLMRIRFGLILNRDKTTLIHKTHWFTSEITTLFEVSPQISPQISKREIFSHTKR